jgi:hypothetical protein
VQNWGQEATSATNGCRSSLGRALDCKLRHESADQGEVPKVHVQSVLRLNVTCSTLYISRCCTGCCRALQTLCFQHKSSSWQAAPCDSFTGDCHKISSNLRQCHLPLIHYSTCGAAGRQDHLQSIGGGVRDLSMTSFAHSGVH